MKNRGKGDPQRDENCLCFHLQWASRDSASYVPYLGMGSRALGSSIKELGTSVWIEEWSLQIFNAYNIMFTYMFSRQCIPHKLQFHGGRKHSAIYIGPWPSLPQGTGSCPSMYIINHIWSGSYMAKPVKCLSFYYVNLWSCDYIVGYDNLSRLPSYGQPWTNRELSIRDAAEPVHIVTKIRTMKM